MAIDFLTRVDSSKLLALALPRLIQFPVQQMGRVNQPQVAEGLGKIEEQLAVRSLDRLPPSFVLKIKSESTGIQPARNMA